MVGVFDIDWFLDARFTRLLDTMAASPRAFGAVRFFGALSSGEKENVYVTSSGSVWRRPEEPINLSVTLIALEALTSRGLIPFIGLTYFPSAVSKSPLEPPTSFNNWQRLVQSFLDQAVQRFGAAEVGRWWLEVWNEPNLKMFWYGNFEQYLDLYRATSEAVLRSGHAVKIGGPAIAYLPEEGPPLMERFLEFLHVEPDVKCDFISLHRKGVWTRQEAQPKLERSVDAMRETARVAARIDPDRFRGMPIINNEADMKVGFERPYEPRMTEQFPSWLVAQAVAYDRLSTEYRQPFWAASDNAEQELIQAPFDGRRSIMTRLGVADDLVKVPVYGFYELLRLLQPQRASVESDARIYPRSDLYHLTTASVDAITAIFTFYPNDDNAIGRDEWHIEYVLRDVPWTRVNVARFRIDKTLSNSFTMAGRAMPARHIDLDMARRIRLSAELAVSDPIRTDVVVTQQKLRETFDLPAFATVLIWVTPYSSAPPTAPRWLGTEVIGANVLLRWAPNEEPSFYSYELRRISSERGDAVITPAPLRAAIWIDTPPPGRHFYEICVISASGARSRTVASPEIAI